MSEPVIIASLMRYEGVTGLQTHVREFAMFLKRAGVPFEIATPFSRGGLLAYAFVAIRQVFEKTFKPVAVLIYRHGHSFLLQRHLKPLLAGGQACTVYAQCPLSAAVALRWRTSPRQRVVLVAHFNVSQADEWAGKGMISADGSIARGIKAFEADTLARLDGVVFVSRFMRESLLERIPALRQVSHVVLPNFVAAPPSNEPMPGLSGRDLVSIGTLEARKNQRFLIELLGKAKARGTEITLTLVGDGPDRQALESRALELGVHGQIRFEGHQSNARRWIPGHRLYVHSALMENLPIVLVEALAAGVPLVAAQVGGIPEVIHDGVEGRFWPLDDVDKACDLVLGLLADDGARASMKAVAETRFRDDFETNAVASKLLAFLRAPATT